MTTANMEVTHGAAGERPEFVEGKEDDRATASTQHIECLPDEPTDGRGVDATAKAAGRGDGRMTLDQAGRAAAILSSGPLEFTVRVAAPDLRDLLSERIALRKQVTELQAAATKTLESTLARRVRSFHAKFGHPTRSTPQVPAEEEVRFRLALITEEYLELLHSCLDLDALRPLGIHEAVGKLRNAINGEHPYQRAPVVVDLPECMDACTDLDFVVEGTRAAFGVNGGQVLDAVFAANMAKDAVYVQDKDGFHMGRTVKPTKPAGWAPPDIAGVLRAQGYKSP